jgi:two-component system NtrC family sensor kinase
MSFDKMTKLSWIYDLYRLGRAGSTEHSGQEYQQLLTHIVAGFEAQTGSLALCSDDGGSLTIVAGIDLPAGVVGSSMRMGERVLGWVAKEGTALLLNGSVANDPRFPKLPARSETGSPSSAMCWPLKIEKRIIGAVSVNRRAGQAAYTEADLEQGTIMLGLVSLALENAHLQIDQQRRIAELKGMNQKLEEAQNQLLQSEKMASIGQLAAGVAHEINNPIGFVYSNLGTLEKYVKDIFSLIELYGSAEEKPDLLPAVRELKAKVDLDFLKEDVSALMHESRDGITRVKKIVQDLKDFSHVDASDEWTPADLHAGLDSTLNIVSNEVKYKAEVTKDYGDIPEVECLPSQLNQVFMNLLVNAAHAIDERGTITIRTSLHDSEVWVEVADNGKGIPAENLKRIFDPFFTTKPVGKGTGLGLSLSYSIVQKHGGKIEVASEVGKGTTFSLRLPVKRPRMESAGVAA